MRNNKHSILMSFELPFTVEKDEFGYWISECPPLRVLSQGDTRDEAVENLKEAVSLFLVNSYDRGVLNDVLRECGITTQQVLLNNNEKESQHFEVNIPLHIASNNSHQHSECRV